MKANGRSIRPINGNAHADGRGAARRKRVQGVDGEDVIGVQIRVVRHVLGRDASRGEVMHELANRSDQIGAVQGQLEPVAGDVAVASGPLPPPTDRLWHIARLAWRTVPYAFARAGRPAPGPVVFDLVAPSGDGWVFGPEAEPGGGDPDDLDVAVTTVSGDALDLCLVAGQRADAADTGLVGTGPDADAVLALVRTFA